MTLGSGNISAPHKNCKHVEEMHLDPAAPYLVNRSHKPRHCTDLGMVQEICQNSQWEAEIQIACKGNTRRKQLSPEKWRTAPNTGAARGGLERHFYLAELDLATGVAWRFWPCNVISVDPRRQAKSKQRRDQAKRRLIETRIYIFTPQIQTFRTQSTRLHVKWFQTFVCIIRSIVNPALFIRPSPSRLLPGRNTVFVSLNDLCNVLYVPFLGSQKRAWTSAQSSMSKLGCPPESKKQPTNQPNQKTHNKKIDCKSSTEKQARENQIALHVIY